MSNILGRNLEWDRVEDCKAGYLRGISNSPWGKKDTKEVLLIHLIRVFVLFSSPVSTSYNLNWTVEDEKESVFGIWKTLSKNLSIIGRRCTRTKLTEWWRQFLLYTLDNNNIIGIIIKSVLSGQSFRIRKVSRCPETNLIEIIK